MEETLMVPALGNGPSQEKHGDSVGRDAQCGAGLAGG